jgi:hypothetical protein
MRAPRRKNPRKDDRLVPGPDTDLPAMAKDVDYVISTEHKDHFTSAGPGNLRSDATRCPRGLNFDNVRNWLKEAVRSGDVSAVLDGDFPRYAWKRIDTQVYEARLSNSGLGQYKGYPIEDHEAPEWLK